MAQNVKLPNGQIVSFPDDATPAEIDGALNTYYPQFAPKEHPYDTLQRVVDTAISNTIPTETLPEVPRQPEAEAEAAAREDRIRQRREAEGIDKLGTFGRYTHSFASGAGLATGTGINYIGRRFGIQSLEELGNQIQDVAAARTPADQTFSEQVVSGVGSVASAFATAAPISIAAESAPVLAGIAGIATFAPRIAKGLQIVSQWAPSAFAGAFEAAGNATQTYDDVLKKTGNKDLALHQADKTFLWNLPVNAALDKIGIFNKEGGVASRIIRAKLAEGTQEGVQQAISNYFAGNPVGEQFTQNAVVGGVVGGLAKAGHIAVERLAGKDEDDSATPPPDINNATNVDDAIAAANASLQTTVGDELTPAIDAFKADWEARMRDAAPPPMIGMEELAPQSIAMPERAAPQDIFAPDRPLSKPLLELAELLRGMNVEEQTRGLMRLDPLMRRDVSNVMRALDDTEPAGLIVPGAGIQPGQGEAGRITNEATLAASSVQPAATMPAATTGVPALTERAAQEIVSKTPGMEMRPHRDVADRFEVVPAVSTAGEARGVFSTQPVPVAQQQLADQEAPAVAAAPAPAVAPTVAPALTLEQQQSNQAALDAERSSLPRRMFGEHSRLRSESGPDIKGERVTRPMRKFLAQLGRLTGTKIVFEYAPNESDGVVPVHGENTIHINTAATINPLSVMGHEVTHVLKDKHREAWQAIRTALSDTLGTGEERRAALLRFADDYWFAHPDRLEAIRNHADLSTPLTDEEKRAFGTSENTIEDFLLDELTSDLGGAHWSSEQFWTDTFAKIEKQHGDKARGIIERLVSAIKESLNKFMMLVRQHRQAPYTTISAEQIEKTRDAVTSAYAKFINEERRNAPEHVEDVGVRDMEAEPAYHSNPTGEQQGADLDAARRAELGEIDLAESRNRDAETRIFFEVAPNPNNIPLKRAWDRLSDKQQRSISEEIKQRVIPGLLKSLGIRATIQGQLGGWMNDTNPSFALVVKGGDVAMVARAITHVLDQESVYTLGLKPFTGAQKSGIIRIEVGDRTRTQIHQLYMAIRGINPEVILGHSTINGEMLIGLPIETMQEIGSKVIDTLQPFNVEGVDFIQGYSSNVTEGDYESWLYGSPGEHSEARDIDRWQADARRLFAGRSDGTGRPGLGSSLAEEARRSERRDGAVSAVGIHYSQAKRDYLASSAFGTGLKGAENERIAQSGDPRLKHRIYFYVNTGRAIRPEAGVGAHAHRAELTGLYDLQADQRNLTLGRDANEFESALLDAGYNGYISHDQGVAVMLGPRSMRVDYMGLNNNPEVPVAERGVPSAYKEKQSAIMSSRILPAGQLTGAEWKAIVPAVVPSVDVSHLDDSRMYYRDQIVKRPVESQPRASERRPIPNWYFSALSKVVDDAQMKTAPAKAWQQWLSTLPTKGIKPEEIEWSGISEWIDAHGDDKISKKAVQDYLANNGVKIETILRGERDPVTYEEPSQREEPEEQEPEDIEPDVTFSNWETEEPNESWLRDSASDRLSEEMDERIASRADEIADDLRESIPDWVEYKDAARASLGSLIDVSDEDVSKEAMRLAVEDAARETFEEFRTGDDDERSDAELIADATRILADGPSRVEEAERRARVEVEEQEDEILEELIDRERDWYYEDSESPQTRQIIVTVGDDEYEFGHEEAYGEHRVFYNGREVNLIGSSYQQDDASIQSAILQHLMDVEGESFSRVPDAPSEPDTYVPVKWERFVTDRDRAQSGSYREVQLLLPPGTVGRPHTRRADDSIVTEREPVSDFYYTAHYPNANYLGHARFDERIDPEGRRVMFLQEVQGDWGQQRRHGLEAQIELTAAKQRLDELVAEKNKIEDQAVAMPNDEARRELMQKHATLGDEINRLQNKITDLQYTADRTPPTAPFIERTTAWAALVVKRLIAHAVEYGFDRVAWTSGEQQVERWASGLRQNVDTIRWNKTQDGIHIVALQRGNVRADTNYRETELTDAIGKLMAKRIIEDPNQSGELTGSDIQLSDTGMAGFYDRMLPNIVNDVLKKLDKSIKVREIDVHPYIEPATVVDASTEDGGVMFNIVRNGKVFDTLANRDIAEQDAEYMNKSNARTMITRQLGFDITDKLRDTAVKGMPMFSERRRRQDERSMRKADDRRAWYYSQLGAAVNAIPGKLRTGSEIALWLQSNAGKLQVKKDELQWSGVLDWLQGQGRAAVTQEQVQDWLRNNGVQVREVVLGTSRQLSDTMRDLMPDTDTFNSADWVAASERFEGIAKQWERNGDKQQADKYWKLSDEATRLSEGLDANGSSAGAVRYEMHTLPGGKDYRELLLTLPANETPEETRVRLKKKYPEWREGQRYDTFMSDEDRTDLERSLEASYNNFHSNHFPDTPNILAHVRFNSRLDADGRRVLFIEELQSDWAQKGRKKGFSARTTRPLETGEFHRTTETWRDELARKWADTLGGQEQARAAVSVLPYADVASYLGKQQELAELEARNNDDFRQNHPQGGGFTPSAPFVTDTKAWTGLALKRMVAYAVDNGFDAIAWTTGEQQADRYDLSKQIDTVEYRRNPEGGGEIVADDKTGRRVLVQKIERDDQLEDYIGKDPAKKMLEQEPMENYRSDVKSYVLHDQDLKVGGEGMKGYYDEIVPQVAKNLGAKVGRVNVGDVTDKRTATVRNNDGTYSILDLNANVGSSKEKSGNYATREEAEAARLEQSQGNQPGFTITDEMRNHVRVTGMPLFSTQRRALEAWAGDTVVRNPDGSLRVMYHGTARDISTFRPKQANAIFVTDSPEFADVFASMSHGWLMRNIDQWMTPEQIADAQVAARSAAKADLKTGLKLDNALRDIDNLASTNPYFNKAVEPYLPSGANIMPVYVRAENPFDYRDPAQIAALEREVGATWAGKEFHNGESVETTHHIGDVERGDWGAIESAPVQAYIRKHHDSFYVREQGKTNLAVFSPNQVKSASGNSGAYSREDNDIRYSPMRQVDTESPAFRKWFGDSKVVDATGEPLRVYHGTAEDFSAFDPTMLGDKTGGADAREGFFFAANSDSADQFTWKNGDKTGSIMPVYLSIRNPARGVTLLDGSNGWAAAREIDAAKAAGHDGIVFDSDMLGHKGNTWVAFSPTQIKSAISNTGEFSADNPDIRYSYRRALNGDFSPRDYVVPQMEPWESNKQLVDLAYVNGKPIRLQVGKDYGAGSGSGAQHIVANSIRDSRRPLDKITDDVGENAVRTVLNVLGSYGATLHDNKLGTILLRVPLAKKAFVLKDRGSYYSIVTLLSNANNVEGNAEWTGRLTFPATEPAVSSEPNSISTLTKPLGEAYGQGSFTSAKWNPITDQPIVARVAVKRKRTIEPPRESAPRSQINAAIARVYKDDRLYEALDFGAAKDSGPFDGGCLIAAKALIRAFGGGELVRIVNDKNNVTDHYGARINGTIYDFLGSAPSPQAWITRFQKEESVAHKLRFEEGYDETSDIPDDPVAEKKIAALLIEQSRESAPRGAIANQPINQTWQSPVMTDWDNFVRKMQDKQVDTKRVLQAIRDYGTNVAEKFDAYLQETLYHGRTATRVHNFVDGELRQLLEDMHRRSLGMQELDDYLWARHAVERNAQIAKVNPSMPDAGSGLTNAQAADILAGNKVTINGRDIQLDAATLRAAAAVAPRIDAITNGTLDLLVKYGLEKQQTVDQWRRTYQHYAPLMRDMEADSGFLGAFNLGLGTGQGFNVRGSASKRAMGSQRSVTDIIANVAMQRERAIVRGEKNRIAQALYGLAISSPNPDFWIPVNPDLNQRLTPASLQKLIGELTHIGVNPIDAMNIAKEPKQRYIDNNTGMVAERINPSLRSRDDVLSTRINGEERFVMFSTDHRAQMMVRSLKNLDADQLGGFTQAVAPVTRWFASINTQFNPIFGLTNGIRDIGTGMLNLSSTPLSGHRADILRNAFSALKGVYLDLRDHRAGRQPTSQWAQLFEQFALDGGQTGYRDMFATSEARANEIAKELKAAGKGQSWFAVGEKHSKVLGWLSDYNTAVENAIRLSAYKVALDNGRSRQDAARIAKELTVNFNRKGLAATQTGALYAFFNAAVQGTARIAETMVKDGKLTPAGQRILYGGMLLGVMQAVMGALAGWDDNEPPQFVREKNLIIPIFGSDKYVSIPMPLGFHVIPNIGRISAEFALSGFKNPSKRLLSLANVILDGFNPIGSGTLAQTLSPTIADPIVALSENKDWTGKSIYKEDFNKMHPTPGWTRTKDTASDLSKWLAYGTNYVTGGGKYEIGAVSPTPDQIDYLISQATGGVGREGLKVWQAGKAEATGEDVPMYKVPVVGRFVGETKGQASEIAKFYDNLKRIGEHKSAIDEMKQAHDSAALQTYYVDHPDARFIQLADRAQREIGYLRRQKSDMIEKGVSRERIKLMEDRITAKVEGFNKMLSEKRE